jgi:hypothetical protein
MFKTIFQYVLVSVPNIFFCKHSQGKMPINNKKNNLFTKDLLEIFLKVIYNNNKINIKNIKVKTNDDIRRKIEIICRKQRY